MKKIISIALLSLTFFTSLNTFAQETNLRIAFINTENALFGSDAARLIDAELKLQTAEDEAQIRAIIDTSSALQQSLQAQEGEPVDEAEQRRITELLQENEAQYNFLLQKIQTLLSESRNQFEAAYSPSLIQVITEIVEEENLDAVFHAGDAIFFTDALDITALAIEKLNQQ